MAELTDPRLLEVFFNALTDNLRFSGYVTWKPNAQEWLRRNCPQCTTRRVGELMHEHVQCRRKIDQVRETREEWSHCGHHYDFILDVDGDRLYVETVIVSDEPGDCQIEIVNVHYDLG